jgi:hypothetical protein
VQEERSQGKEESATTPTLGIQSPKIISPSALEGNKRGWIFCLKSLPNAATRASKPEELRRTETDLQARPKRHKGKVQIAARLQKKHPVGY